MTKFEICSVAEDNYESDRLSATATSFATRKRFYTESYTARNGEERLSHKTEMVSDPTTLKISVTTSNKLIVRLSAPNTVDRRIEFNNVDLDSLIEYLKETKTFIEQERLIGKLKGTIR